MTYAVMFLGAIVLVFGVIAFLDWLGSRKDAQSHR